MDFIGARIDYVLFLGSIALVVFAINAVSIRQVGNRTRAWLWLAIALFAAAVGRVPEVLVAAGQTAYVSPLWQASIGAVMFSGFAEFARSAPGRIRRWTTESPRALIVHLPVIAILVAGYYGTPGPVLGIAVGIAALGAARALATTPVEKSRWLLVGSAGFLGFNALTYTTALFLPTSSDAYTLMALLRTIGSIGSMAMLGSYVLFETERVVAGSRWRAYASRLIVAALLAAVLVLGFVVTEFAGRAGENSALGDLVLRTRTIAATLGVDDVAALTGTIGDYTNPSYGLAATRLRAVLRANPDVRHAHVMRLVDGEAVLIVEGSRAGEAAGAPGRAYEEATPELLEALERGTGFTEGPLEDAWGVWYTAFAPVTDPFRGTYLGLVGLDIPSTIVSERIALYRLVGIGASLIVCVLVIGLYLVLQMSRSAAAAVASSEYRFRALFEDAPEAILVVDAHSQCIVAANAFTQRWLGFSADDLGAMSYTDISVKSCAAMQEGSNMGECAQAASGACACVWKSATGQSFEVEITTLQMVYDGHPSILMYARDMSEKRAAQRAMESHAEFSALITDISRSFIDATPQSIEAVTRRALARIGTFACVDRTYVFAFDEQNTMSNTHEWVEAGVPSRRDQMQNVRMDMYPTLTARLQALREIHLPDVGSSTSLSDRERRHFEAAGIRSMLAVPMVVGGHCVGLLGFDSIRESKEWTPEAIAVLRMVADMIASATQRTQAEADMRKLSRAVEQSPAAVIITDAEGSIEYVNRKFTQLTGYTLDEARGQNPRILKSGMTDEQSYPVLWATLTSGQEWTGELVNRRKDGSVYWANAVISAMRGTDGMITHYVGVQQDVSAMKEAMAAIEHAKESAETANRAKSEFLSTMSHEIRTPMNAIIGMAELLRDTELTSQQSRYVEIFQNAGEALLSLINSVLDLSKIEAERMDLEQIPTDLTDLIETTSSVMGLQAAEKGIELLYRIKPETPTVILGDPARLRQVITNLLGNAIKFTEKGTVLVSLEQDPDRAEPGALLFSVSDTGIGISPEKLESVFERFTQADSSTTRKYGGTGLGLTISKRLVEMMNGRMWAESTVGEGTTFFFAIPFPLAETAEETRRASARKTPEDAVAGVRVLVVDDNDTNRLIVSEILSGHGAKVADADHALVGLEMLRSGVKAGSPYDVVVLDHQMPDIDGYQFLEMVRDEQMIAGTAVLMLSSDARGRDGERSRTLGLVDYLLKPVRRNELVETVALAASSVWRTPTVAAVSAPNPTTADGADCRPLRILVVDDSEDNRFLMESYLATTVHELGLAVNGQEALDAVIGAETPFDLVFMDVQMPVMDGYDATQRIREWERDHGREPTTIVALTAFALKEEIERTMNAGCDAHLTKPIKKKQLLEAIANYGETNSHV